MGKTGLTAKTVWGCPTLPANMTRTPMKLLNAGNVTALQKSCAMRREGFSTVVTGARELNAWLGKHGPMRAQSGLRNGRRGINHHAKVKTGKFSQAKAAMDVTAKTAK